MEKLVTSKEVSEKLKKLGVRQESFFRWIPPYPNYNKEWHIEATEWHGRSGNLSAYTITELGELLKPYMKDIEISARDDIFNPDFWGNYLISKLEEINEI